MIPKYSINLLRSVVTWLDSRSGTVWAREHGHTSLMKDYAKDLNLLALHLHEDRAICKHCGGLIDAPLGREPSELDCPCTLTDRPRPVVDNQLVHDLEMTVRRLANRVHKYNSDDPLIKRSLDFLERRVAKPSPLRKD